MQRSRAPHVRRRPVRTTPAAAARPGSWESLESRTLMSTTWVVAPSGSLAGDGSAANPFLTIQQAAGVAAPGDTVLIHAGTYTESVVPANSGTHGAPINYLAAGDGTVTISGGVDPSAAFSRPAVSNATAISVNGDGTATLYSPAITAGLAGQTLHVAPGQGWVWQTGQILDSSAGQLTYSYVPLHGGLKYEIPGAGNPFYVTNRSIPSVPAAFDLSGRSHINISGISLRNATIITDASSNYVLLDHVNAVGVSAFDGQPDPWGHDSVGGIQLIGSHDTLQNSTIAWSSGNGVYLNGSYNAVLNCTIHDVDLGGGDQAGVLAYGSNMTIQGNTIYNTGRDGIKISHSAAVQVIGNTIHDVMQLTTDGGAIYTYGTDGTGSNIDYNTIYNVYAGGYGAAGLYFDNGSSNYEAQGNLLYSVQIPVKTNPPGSGLTLTNNGPTSPGAAGAPAAVLLPVPAVPLVPANTPTTPTPTIPTPTIPTPTNPTPTTPTPTTPVPTSPTPSPATPTPTPVPVTPTPTTPARRPRPRPTRTGDRRHDPPSRRGGGTDGTNPFSGFGGRGGQDD